MQVTIFGASGKVGRLVVAMAIRRHYKIVAVTYKHNPFTAEEASGTVRVITGDIHDPAVIGQALSGSDCVISCLSSWKSRQRNVVSSAVRHLIPAMETASIDRIITLTGAGAFYAADQPHWLARLNRGLLNIAAHGILKDGEDQLALLSSSQLQWTCLRSPVMTSAKSSNYRLHIIDPLPLATIPRQAVAQALVDLVEDRDWLQQAPYIGR